MNQPDRPVLQSKLSQLNVVPKYAKYKPKINLEILTAKKAETMLILTYFMFFACLAGVILNNIFGARTEEISNTPPLYTNYNSSSQKLFVYKTNFTFNNPSDVLVYHMTATQTNFTSLIGWEYGSQANVCSSVVIVYLSEIFACFDSNGCTNFASTASTSTTQSNEWQLVLGNNPLKFVTDMCTLRSSNKFTLDIIPAKYHIQVSLSDNPF